MRTVGARLRRHANARQPLGHLMLERAQPVEVTGKAGPEHPRRAGGRERTDPLSFQDEGRDRYRPLEHLADARGRGLIAMADEPDGHVYPLWRHPHDTRPRCLSLYPARQLLDQLTCRTNYGRVELNAG